MSDEIKNIEMRVIGDAGSAEAALQKLTTIMGQFNASVARQNASLAALNAQSRQQTDALKTLSAAATKAAAEEKKVDDTSKALTADLRAATAAMQQAAKATNDLAAAHREAAKAAKEQASQESATAAAAASSSRSMVVGAAAVAVAIGGIAIAAAATKATISEAFDQLERGIKVDNITRAFDTLQSGALLNADSQLQKIRETTHGLISDFDLMEKSNLWQTLRLAPDQFDELAGAAVKLGAAVGRDAGQAINDLTVGLGRMSPRILDNLGIIVKAEEANERYAASIGKTVDKLTDEERRTAFLTLAIERIQEAAAKLPEPAENAGRAYERLKASVANAADSFALAVANSEPLKEAIDGISTTLEETDWARWGELFAGAASKAINAVNTLLRLLPDANNKYIQLAEYAFGLSPRAEVAALQKENASLRNPDIVDLVSNLGKPRSENRQRLNQNQARIDELMAQMRAQNDAIANRNYQQLKGQAIGALGSFATGTDIYRAGEQIYRAYSTQISKIIDDEKKATTEREKNADKAAKAAERQREKVEQLRDEWARTGNEIERSDLSNALNKAIEAGNEVDFSALKEKLLASLEEGYRQSMTKYEGVIEQSEIDQRIADKLAGDNAKLDEKWDEQSQKMAEKLREESEKAFRSSVDFFADIFTTTIDGTSQSIQEILGDALKRVAIGFGSQMLASITTSLGFNFGDLGSAQGLGQSIAASFGFGGGGVQGLGDLFGETPLLASATALDGSAVALTSAATALTSAAGAQALKPPGTPQIVGAQSTLDPGMETIITKAGIAAAVAVTAALSANNAFGSFKAGQQGGVKEGLRSSVDSWDDFALAAGTMGLSTMVSAAAGVIGGLTGGSTDPEKLRRRDLRGQLQQTQLGESLTFGGVNGPISLFDQSYNLDTSNPLSGQAAGLVNPLAQIFAGGSGTGGEQLAGIFANAVSDAKNFNEVLVNTSSLMDKLGYDAEGAKDQVTQLFLDGDIKLNEFGADIQALNTLAQDNLVGTGSVRDAVEILANAIDNDPRVALKGLEFAFKEMAELGITSTEQIRAYVAENFGPDVQDVFDELAAAGIDSWEDIQGASADTLFAIFSTLDRFKNELVNTFGDAAREANNAFDLSGSRDEIQKTITKTKELRGEYDRLPG